MIKLSKTDAQELVAFFECIQTTGCDGLRLSFADLRRTLNEDNEVEESHLMELRFHRPHDDKWFLLQLTDKT